MIMLQRRQTPSFSTSSSWMAFLLHIMGIFCFLLGASAAASGVGASSSSSSPASSTRSLHITRRAALDEAEEKAAGGAFHISNYSATSTTTTTGDFYSECHREVIKVDLDKKNPHAQETDNHKQTYRIAVHAVRGLQEDMELYNATFATYLTATAGRRFDPPVSFELVPVTYSDLFNQVEETDETHEQVDFIFANPGSYSCIGVEYGVQPLATKISHLEVRGHTYELDVFGGVIFTRMDNDDIHSILDLKDKVIGASSFSSLMGGQTQMYEMVKAGMDYVMDPAQVVFTENKVDVVEGVLQGKFDVGFVRTDQIERHRDTTTGQLVNPNEFRILEPRVHVLDDGTLFPFLHSTEIYGEWPVAALTHVPDDVIVEVQSALLALNEHKKPWQALLECMDLEEEAVQGEDNKDNNKGDKYSSVYQYEDATIACNARYWEEITRCDTTPEIAQYAYEAGKKGKHFGFRSPRSYFEVRTMQEMGGFMTKNEHTGDWACAHSDNLYESLSCPPNHYKLPLEEFHTSCEQVHGLECPDGNECYCKPCVKAFEVAIFQYDPTNATTLENQNGCEKMDLCGSMEQKQEVYFMVVDNKRRHNPVVTALIHLGHYTHDLTVEKLSNHTYQIHWNENTVGEGIVEVSFDGEQIPESPIRIHILPRTCLEASRVPDYDGDCICDDDSIPMAGGCVPSTIIAIVCSVLGMVVAVVVGYIVVRHKNYMNDLVWHVNPDELHFDDPMEIIGDGAFGVVLLAEYRGTKVAIKRAVKRGSSGGGTGSGSRSKGAPPVPRRSDIRVSQIGDALLADELFPQETNKTNKKKGRRPSVDISVSSQDIDVESAHSGFVSNADSGFLSNDSAEFSDIQKNSRSPGMVSFEGGSSRRDGKRPTRKAQSMYKSKRSFNRMDIGFLADKFGRGKKKTGWFGNGTTSVNDRFEAAIGGSSKTGSVSRTISRTIVAALCPGLDADKRRREEFIAEMRLLSTLRHPCICTIMGAVMATAHGPMIVMEYMEYGSLHDLLRNETMYLSGEVILQIARDVAQGLRYLHSAKPPILHGDLKPANILVDSRFRAKVCDFGLSKKEKNTISGSLFWLAPEYLIGNEEYNPACDMYSMGVILNETYSRVRPYEGEDLNLRELLSDICDRRVNKRPYMSPTCPPKMVDLIKKLWARDPANRPQAKQLDSMLVELNIQDVEPLTPDQMNAKPRTQDMLYEIFPKHIAEALKAGRKVEPENHDMVSIVFSDIKGFTDISREISPMKVSEMLDRLYLAFDKIAGKHKVFKVETIGDAYMGVTNLVEDQTTDHVKRIAEFAVDMIDEASKILIDEEDPDRGYISIRVGFHSGPVVANVIGSLNPRYGLFGDTVNTASRMESNSSGGRILCSESSFQLLKRQAPEMPYKSRGKIPVKGKGEMNVFWIGDRIIRRNKLNGMKSVQKDPLLRALSSHSGTSRSDTEIGPFEESTNRVKFVDISAHGSSEFFLEEPDVQTAEDKEKLEEVENVGKTESLVATEAPGDSQTTAESSECFEDEPPPVAVEKPIAFIGNIVDKSALDTEEDKPMSENQPSPPPPSGKLNFEKHPSASLHGTPKLPRPSLGSLKILDHALDILADAAEDTSSSSVQDNPGVETVTQRMPIDV